VIDGLFTVWRGSIIGDDCEITLRHTDFPTATQMCSQGNLSVTGRGIQVQNNCYISQLTLMVTSSVNNKTVECHNDDGSGILNIGVRTLYLSQSKLVAIEYCIYFKSSQLQRFNNFIHNFEFSLF
jgi:hypothetical protein